MQWSSVASRFDKKRLSGVVDADPQMARTEVAPPTVHPNEIIKPQYAIQPMFELTKDRDTYITTEVGQHQDVGRRNSTISSRSRTAG